MIYALVIVTAFHTTPRRRQSSLLTARSRRQKAQPRMKLAHALRTHSVPALAALALLAGPMVRPASAQTLTFDNLATEPGVSGDANPFSDANGGSRTVSGVTFNAATNSDWEVIGNQYKAPFSSDFFGQSHSGDYYLAGSAYVGTDNLNHVYTGLTLSTTQALSSLYVGFDNNGGGSNDADTLTITAFGMGGNLASQTVTLNGPALSLLDTSGVFGGLTGVTGYRFETTASNALYAGYGQAYLVADDLTFKAPVPEASTPVSLGLLLALGLGGLVLAKKRRRA